MIQRVKRNATHDVDRHLAPDDAGKLDLRGRRHRAATGAAGC